MALFVLLVVEDPRSRRGLVFEVVIIAGLLACAGVAHGRADGPRCRPWGAPVLFRSTDGSLR